MGLDAKMYLVVPSNVTDLQIEEASRDIHEFFFKGYTYVTEKCLRVVDKPIFDDYEIIVLSDGERCIDVDCFGRYYGTGYERGHFPNIKLVSEFLEMRFPASRQFYGSDCSGVNAFLKADRDLLWAHYCKVGNRPYFGPKKKEEPAVGTPTDGK